MCLFLMSFVYPSDWLTDCDCRCQLNFAFIFWVNNSKYQNNFYGCQFLLIFNVGFLFSAGSLK